MTESTDNELRSALFARIRQLVDQRGVDIRPLLSGNALRLEFADGQRILVNFDTQTQTVWLAARSGGIEFVHCGGGWHTRERHELFAKLSELIEQTIASDPRNARAPTLHTPRIEPAIRPDAPESDAPESHVLRNVLIVVLAAALGFWAALRLGQTNAPNNEAAGSPAETMALKPEAGQACEGGFPANGTVNVFAAGLRTDGPNDPEITLRNDHAYPLLFILAAPRTTIPAASVVIHARQSAALHLPAGQYEILFASGTAWCNARSGFSDGHLVKFNTPLTVQMEKPMQLAMQSSGAGAEDFQLFVKTLTPAAPIAQPSFSGDGSMEVPRHADGHFYLPGTIENVPVTFMVDTGASVTSISGDIARQAGVRNCKEVQFQTANGAATGCIALVANMTLGNFVLKNITVAVMPNMESNLLGANVLRNFQVSQNDTGMLIGRR